MVCDKHSYFKHQKLCQMNAQTFMHRRSHIRWPTVRLHQFSSEPVCFSRESDSLPSIFKKREFSIFMFHNRLILLTLDHIQMTVVTVNFYDAFTYERIVFFFFHYIYHVIMQSCMINIVTMSKFMYKL